MSSHRIPRDPAHLLAEIEAARAALHEAQRVKREGLRRAGEAGRLTKRRIVELERAERRAKVKLIYRRKLAKTLGVPLPPRPRRSVADRVAALERQIEALRAQEAR